MKCTKLRESGVVVAGFSYDIACDEYWRLGLPRACARVWRRVPRNLIRLVDGSAAVEKGKQSADEKLRSRFTRSLVGFVGEGDHGRFRL